MDGHASDDELFLLVDSVYFISQSHFAVLFVALSLRTVRVHVQGIDACPHNFRDM